MQTTEAPIGSAALAAVACGALLTAVAALAGGSQAALGAVVGTAIGVGVLAMGALSVGAVARLMPAASLLFALVTYTFQVLVMALVLIGLNSSGVLDDQVDRSWLGAAIIAVVLVWTAIHIQRSATARIPAYELPPSAAESGSPDRSDHRIEGGAR